MTKPVITVETARRIVFLTEEVIRLNAKLYALNEGARLGHLRGRIVISDGYSRNEDSLSGEDISQMVINRIREHYHFKIRDLVFQLKDLGSQSPIGTPDWL